jgi:hypothetical protein
MQDLVFVLSGTPLLRASVYQETSPCGFQRRPRNASVKPGPGAVEEALGSNQVVHKYPTSLRESFSNFFRNR